MKNLEGTVSRKRRFQGKMGKEVGMVGKESVEENSGQVKMLDCALRAQGRN